MTVLTLQIDGTDVAGNEGQSVLAVASGVRAVDIKGDSVSGAR